MSPLLWLRIKTSQNSGVDEWHMTDSMEVFAPTIFNCSRIRDHAWNFFQHTHYTTRWRKRQRHPHFRPTKLRNNALSAVYRKSTHLLFLSYFLRWPQFSDLMIIIFEKQLKHYLKLKTCPKVLNNFYYYVMLIFHLYPSFVLIRKLYNDQWFPTNSRVIRLAMFAYPK